MQFPEVEHLSRASLIADDNANALKDLLKHHKISDKEFDVLKDILKRKPTFAELGVFSAMWSEHCSYKSSRVHLKRLPTEGPQVVVGPGENAGVVHIDDKLCVAFKMESHNHPSYIEPYQGAATGVGGIMRDVFCMGARPVANLNSLRFGDRSHQRTSYLVDQVVAGIGDYGNCVGIPTVAGSISYDDSYNGNCLVNAMTIGTIHADKIFKGYASGEGNLLIYLGSATGRDGIHGATMASDSFQSEDASERSAVQVGDPFTEKLLMEATLEALDKGLIVGLQDMGAAGLTSSSFEMADRAGNGLFIDLDQVPVRTSQMSAYELMLSESQERMLMVIKPDRWDDLQQLLAKWELPCTIIGKVTGTGRVQIHHQGRLEVDIPVGPIVSSAPCYERPIDKRTEPPTTSSFVPTFEKADLKDLVLKMLVDTGSQSPVIRQYDWNIGNQTVLSPEQQGAALLWLRSPWAKNQNVGLATATACNERYCKLDSKLGAIHAVMKCARMIAATGAKPLAITDCMNFGNPEDPSVMREFSDAIDGIKEACLAIDTPVVSGNVSLYNETDGISIKPTPMIGMIGKHENIHQAVPAIVQSRAAIYWIRPKGQEPAFGGSLATKTLKENYNGALPAVDFDQETEVMAWLQDSAKGGELQMARDVGAGGVATAMLKSLITGTENSGFKFHEFPPAELFGEWSGSYIVMGDFSDEHLKLQHSEVLSLGDWTDAGIDFGSFQLEREQIESAFQKSNRTDQWQN